MSEDSKEPGFKVADRRRFNPDGSERTEDGAPAPPGGASEAGEGDRPGDSADFSHRPKPEPTGIDFSGFVLSLAQSALIDLGVAPHPETGETHKNLHQAQNTIDILGIVHEKTAGNLTPEEERLLTGLLYQIRLSFVESK